MDLYQEAAAVLEKFENKLGSVKSLVFASNYKNVRQLYALVCESLKYQPVLNKIYQQCESLQKQELLQAQPHLSTVLLYDHLVGKGLGRAGKIRSCIVKHKREIEGVKNILLEERGVASLADLLSSQCQALNKLQIPRYARVNLLKTTVDDVVAAFTAEDWVWVGLLSPDNFQKDVESLGEDKFGLDPLLPDLLIFPPGTDLHDHPMTSSGNIVLQDRASCFPAHVLDPPQGSTVLDCCAAPGNKTSHAASLMANSGKILAYERDGKRMSLLQHQLRKMGVWNTKVRHQDFLSVDPKDEEFADVQFILVDPSCSGSGIMNRMDHVNDNDRQKTESAQRLQSLQRFQISILKHALNFPAAQRVVYSTCSVYEEENEAVVTEVAEQFKDRFCVKAIFPEFPHRGKGNVLVTKSCLRMSPKKDLTNGFFVACFERLQWDYNEKEEWEEEEEEETMDEEKEGIARVKENHRKRNGSTGLCDNREIAEQLETASKSFQEENRVNAGGNSVIFKEKKNKKRNSSETVPESVRWLETASNQLMLVEAKGTGGAISKKRRKKRSVDEQGSTSEECTQAERHCLPENHLEMGQETDSSQKKKKVKKKKKNGEKKQACVKEEKNSRQPEEESVAKLACERKKKKKKSKKIAKGTNDGSRMSVDEGCMEMKTKLKKSVSGDSENEGMTDTVHQKKKNRKRKLQDGLQNSAKGECDQEMPKDDT